MNNDLIESVTDGYGLLFPPEVQAVHRKYVLVALHEYEEYIRNLPPQQMQLTPFHDKPGGYRSTSIGV